MRRFTAIVVVSSLILTINSKLCERAELCKFIRTDGVKLSGHIHLGQQVNSNILSQCLRDCAYDPSCRSVSHNGAVCSTSNQDEHTVRLVEDSRAIYYEKICLIGADRENGCPLVFKRTPQRILAGIADTIISAESLEECIVECVNSFVSRERQCTSVMMFYEDTENNCILNVNNKDNVDSERFVSEFYDAVDYVDVNCNLSTEEIPPPRNARAQTLAELDAQGRENAVVTTSKENERLFLNFGGKEPVVTKDVDKVKRAKDGECLMRYGRLRGYRRREFATTVLLALRYCIQRCDRKPDCIGFQYHKRRCTVFTIITRDLEESASQDYYRKFCLDSTILEKYSCPKIFETIPNKILRGHIKGTLIAESLKDCIQECILAAETYGYICRSVMYLQYDKECLLSEESRISQPMSKFEDEKELNVDYYEVPCTPRN